MNQPATTPGIDADIAIIGAGAAGLMAGIFAARSAPAGTKVVLLDGAKKPGAKILIAGGGRCNVTHDVVHVADYAGSASGNTVKKVLKSFSVQETVAFFAELGVDLKREDTGKLFPTTNKARTVLDALLTALADSGAELRADHRVTGVERVGGDVASGGATQLAEGLLCASDRDVRTQQPSGQLCGTPGSEPPGSEPPGSDPTHQPRFRITTNHGTLTAHRVVLATGGKALPATGSDGFGYTLAQNLGHTVTDTWPALVPLVLQDGNWLTELSGITLDVELTLSGKTGKVLHRQGGPMLLAHFGVTGPAAMDMSRHLRDYANHAPRKLTANLFPGESFDQVEKWMMDEAGRSPTSSVSTPLKRRLPGRVVEGLLGKYLGLAADLPLARLSKDDRKALCHALTGLHLPVVGDRGFKLAEVTAGGVPMDQVQTATMASKVCEGLYLCGEILDVDGRIGGYNFQWAWCTGRLAGLAAAADGARSVSE